MTHTSLAGKKILFITSETGPRKVDDVLTSLLTEAGAKVEYSSLPFINGTLNPLAKVELNPALLLEIDRHNPDAVVMYYTDANNPDKSGWFATVCSMDKELKGKIPLVVSTMLPANSGNLRALTQMLKINCLHRDFIPTETVAAIDNAIAQHSKATGQIR
jgi:hypothetical protein